MARAPLDPRGAPAGEPGATWPHAYRVRVADLAAVGARRRWRRHVIPDGAVPDRLAAVAAIAGIRRG